MVLIGWLLCVYRIFVYTVVLRAPVSVCHPHLLQQVSENEPRCVFFMFNCWKYLFSKSRKIVFQISKVLKMLVDNDLFV